mgnify:CR=1 FL=1
MRSGRRPKGMASSTVWARDVPSTCTVADSSRAPAWVARPEVVMVGDRAAGSNRLAASLASTAGANLGGTAEPTDHATLGQQAGGLRGRIVAAHGGQTAGGQQGLDAGTVGTGAEVRRGRTSVVAVLQGDGLGRPQADAGVVGDGGREDRVGDAGG